MNKRRKQQRSLSPRPIRAIAFSTLAAALVLAPVVMDVETGSLGWSSAFAKSCFRAGTRVRMADGSEKAIELVKVGDQVLGNNGSINRVREVEKVPLAERLLYRINGGRAFVTEEHPFMSTAGWRSISPAATFRENAHLRVAPMRVGDSLLMFAGYRELPGIGVGATARQIAWEPAFEPVRVRAIDAVEADPHESVYNLLLDGDNTYIADGYLVHNKGGGSGGSGSGSGGSGSGSGSSGSGSGSSGSGSGSSGSGSGSSGSGSGSSGSGSSGSGSDSQGSSSDSGRSDGSPGSGRGRGRGRGSDDGPGHDLGDDHGRRGRGLDDGPGHDLGDDHGRRGRGLDDGPGHDLGDDHGRRGRGLDDGPNHDLADDRGRRGRGIDDGSDHERGNRSRNSAADRSSTSMNSIGQGVGDALSAADEASAIGSGWR